ILPIAQYPEIAPPTVQVTCIYPGASAQVVQDTVAAPIEQQVVGVENALYMSSQSASDGSYTLTVTFALGTNLNMAQVLVQNRVAQALPLLPDIVQQTGVTTKKKSPSILLAVALFAENDEATKKPKFDQLYISNYATIQVRDELARLEGVGDVTILGQQDYSMRVWLDPDQLATRDLTAGDVVKALQEQNVQVAASLAVWQLPGSNALDTADRVKSRMHELERRFPPGLRYRIDYDTTPFIRESVAEVFKTLRDAVILVAIVVLVFLQDWKALVLPM